MQEIIPRRGKSSGRARCPADSSRVDQREQFRPQPAAHGRLVGAPGRSDPGAQGVHDLRGGLDPEVGTDAIAPRCDAVVIATPNFTHVDIMRDALAVKELHILVEKPRSRAWTTASS